MMRSLSVNPPPNPSEEGSRDATCTATRPYAQCDEYRDATPPRHATPSRLLILRLARKIAVPAGGLLFSLCTPQLGFSSFFNLCCPCNQ